LAQHQIAAAADKAAQAAREAAAATEPRLITFTKTRRVRKRNQQRSFIWVYAPGTLHFGRSAEWDLTDNAEARNIKLDDNMVTRLTVGHFDGQRRLLIWAAEGNNSDAFEVKRFSRSKIVANVADYMLPNNLALPPGVAEKFDVQFEEKTPRGKALVIDLDKPIERTTFSTTNKKSTVNTKSQTTAKPAANQAQAPTEEKPSDQ
jgi:hypothetical protein